jgi:hypothetical protein
MDAGAMAFARPAVDALTMSGALAGGALPAFVCRSLVVLVTEPMVLDVTVTTMVHPPAGIDAPIGHAIDDAVTTTPVHVPELAPTVVTPAGIVSVKPAVSVIAEPFAFPNVMVSVAVPPDGIDAGAMVFASVGGVAVTVSGAEAGGAVPASVTSAPVVLVTVPGVLDVIATTIVHPPDGTCAPVAIVTSVDVFVTPAHVPVLAPVMVTPAGIASVNGDCSVSGVALALPIVMVSVAALPMAMVAGAIVLPSVALTAVTVSGAEAGGDTPALVVNVPVVLVTVPGVADVTVATIVHPPTGIDEPLAIVTTVGVLVTPVHVPLVTPAIVTPDGMVSVNGAVSVIGTAFTLPSVIVRVDVPPATIVDGAIALPIVEGTALTVSGACAGGAVPLEVSSVPVTLVTAPGVLDVIVATTVQVPGASVVPAATVIDVGVDEAPAHVPVSPPVIVTPAGIGSVNGDVSAIGVGFGFPSVSVSVAVPPMAMLEGAMDLPSAGGALTTSGAEAAGAVPALVTSALVVLR